MVMVIIIDLFVNLWVFRVTMETSSLGASVRDYLDEIEVERLIRNVGGAVS